MSTKSHAFFSPLYGKQTSGSSRKQNHMAQLRRLDQSVYLADEYLLATDQCHNIYFHKLASDVSVLQKDMDRKIAQEVYNASQFIELHPTATKIWGVNSLRQLFLCSGENFKELMSASPNKPVHLKFEPVNQIFNVMKASMGDRH